jgi:hypothetical protein
MRFVSALPPRAHVIRLVALALIVAMAVLLSAGRPSIAGSPSEATSAAKTEPQRVVIGAFINDIQEIDFRTQSYAVDVYVWFRWTDKSIDPSKSLEFMNRFAPNAHVRDQIYEPPKVLPDGTLYAVVRNQGRFSTKLALGNYPFDKQELVVDLEDSELGSKFLTYVADKTPLTVSPEIYVAGFRLGPARMEIVEHVYPTNFGNPTVGEFEAYSRAKLIVPIERPLTALSVKTFLPILLILACAGMILWVRPAYIDARVGLSVTALLTLLLTLVALQLATGRGQADVDYLTMIDKIYLASYAFILLVLLRVVRASWRDGEHGSDEAVARVDRSWFLFVVGFYAAITALIVSLSLS